MLREIRLYGELGRRFGKVHRLAVESVGEAIRALMANHKGFEQAVLDTAPGYKIWSGTTRLGAPEDIHNPSGAREVIRIAPVVAGAGGGGLGQILIGAALIAVAVFAPVALTGFALYGSVTVGSIAFSVGASLVLGGVAQMLSPQPDLSAGGGERPESRPSYVFNGAVNTSAQGHPVPIGYGRLIVGSAVISAGISTEDI